MCMFARQAYLKRSFFLAAVLLAFGHSFAFADFTELLKRTPQAANCLVLINANEIYKSPIALRDNWKGEHEKGLAVGGLELPAGVQRLVVASEIDVEFLQPTWNAAIAELQGEPNWKGMAARDQGIPDMIGTAPALRLPGDVYLVGLDKQIVGIMAPANRQRVAQWINYRGGNSLSPYLQRAASYVQGLHSEIVLALDLQHAVSRDLIRNRLESFPEAKLPNVNLDNLANSLASIEGVTLGISMGDTTKGKIRFDFSSEMESLAPLAKPIFLQVLSRHGAMIQDFSTWSVEAKGKTIYLEGLLTESGLRRILSLVELPTRDLRSSNTLPTPPMPAVNTPVTNTQTPTAQPEESLARIASQSFFKSVNKLLFDLRNERGGNSYASQALWYDKYARKIDQLPMLHVDPELLSYASQVSAHLRNASLAVKGVGVIGSARAAQITPQAVGTYNYYNPYYRVGGLGYGWGYGANYGSVDFDIRDISAEKRAVRAQEQAKGSQAVVTLMSQIEQETASIRRVMTEKYKAEF